MKFYEGPEGQSAPEFQVMEVELVASDDSDTEPCTSEDDLPEEDGSTSSVAVDSDEDTREGIVLHLRPLSLEDDEDNSDTSGDADNHCADNTASAARPNRDFRIGESCSNFPRIVGYHYADNTVSANSPNHGFQYGYGRSAFARVVGTSTNPPPLPARPPNVNRLYQNPRQNLIHNPDHVNQMRDQNFIASSYFYNSNLNPVADVDAERLAANALPRIVGYHYADNTVSANSPNHGFQYSYGGSAFARVVGTSTNPPPLPARPPNRNRLYQNHRQNRIHIPDVNQMRDQNFIASSNSPNHGFQYGHGGSASARVVGTSTNPPPLPARPPNVNRLYQNPRQNRIHNPDHVNQMRDQNFIASSNSPNHGFQYGHGGSASARVVGTSTNPPPLPASPPNVNRLYQNPRQNRIHNPDHVNQMRDQNFIASSNSPNHGFQYGHGGSAFARVVGTSTNPPPLPERPPNVNRLYQNPRQNRIHNPDHVNQMRDQNFIATSYFYNSNLNPVADVDAERLAANAARNR